MNYSLIFSLTVFQIISLVNNSAHSAEILPLLTSSTKASPYIKPAIQKSIDLFIESLKVSITQKNTLIRYVNSVAAADRNDSKDSRSINGIPADVYQSMVCLNLVFGEEIALEYSDHMINILIKDKKINVESMNRFHSFNHPDKFADNIRSDTSKFICEN